MENHEVRNLQIEENLQLMGRTIASALPEGWGFTLQVFSFGEGGSTFYISNANHEDMVKAMQEFLIKTKTHK